MSMPFVFYGTKINQDFIFVGKAKTHGSCKKKKNCKK